MKNIIIGLFAVAGLVSLSACATILNDDTQRINVTTSTGQEIMGTVDGKQFKAPGIVTVERENEDKIFLTDDPNCNSSTIAPRSVDSKFWINILSGGAFGSTTDYASDDMWRYQDTVTVSCRSK